MGRPRKPTLSRTTIAEVALKLVDREGPDAASMRRIAAALGVNPSSLYNHVDSRVDLVEEIRGLVSAEIDSAPLRDLPWAEGVVAWARSYRAAFAAHPRTIPLLLSTRVSSPVALRLYEDFTLAARRAGWTNREVLPLLTAMESFILGSVLDMSGPAVLFDPRGQEEEFPAFCQAYATLDAENVADPVAGRAFELGLRGLVEGLTKTVAPSV